MNNQKLASNNQGTFQPDLDWSQIRETVMMLNLAVAQIGRAMRDGDDSINTLTESFTGMSDKIAKIAEAGSKLPEGELKETILRNCESVSQNTQSAIMAFQFYDMLSQRLDHVSLSLTSLCELVGDNNKLFNPFAWHELQKKIRSKYPTEQDKLMFDAILKGASIAEALDLSNKPEDGEDEIELF